MINIRNLYDFFSINLHQFYFSWLSSCQQLHETRVLWGHEAALVSDAADRSRYDDRIPSGLDFASCDFLESGFSSSGRKFKKRREVREAGSILRTEQWKFRRAFASDKLGTLFDLGIATVGSGPRIYLVDGPSRFVFYLRIIDFVTPVRSDFLIYKSSYYIGGFH